MKRLIVALVVGFTTAGAGEARAQLSPGPNGSIVLTNPNGTAHVIYPSALNPHAIVPGSVRLVPGGAIHLGTDGLSHGTVTDRLGNQFSVSYGGGASVSTPGGGTVSRTAPYWQGRKYGGFGNSSRFTLPYGKPRMSPWRRR